ncbi:hypothetical protein [Thermoactinospora rubra]|uniref:hypothetical protein n=1 Tax=Thermoactinospora rubra TaxID=1088767 RepID=UPI000A0FBE18|nr:hypothetical protein [Thermoactinospora rubra]
MKKMAVAMVSAVAGGTLLVSGGAASATTTAPSVEITDIAPNPVVVPKGGSASVKIVVEASQDVDKVEVHVKPKDSDVQTLVARQIQQTDKWVFSVPFSSNDPVGRWQATVVGTDKETGKTDTDKATFVVEAAKGKLDTRFKYFSAGPSSVKKGKKIYFSGRLQVNDDGWENLGDADVDIYYRKSGTSGWKWVASAETNDYGRFWAKTRAWKSGTFKAVFDGDDELNGSTSGYDYVRVRSGWYGWHR